MCKSNYLHKIVETDKNTLKILSSPAAPIVVLNSKKYFDNIAPNNPTLGVFLPYAPLHFLLLKDDFNYLLMTSANINNFPIAADEKDIKGLCDYYLTNDRKIVHRSDDSVIIPFEKKLSAPSYIIARRSRGFVPSPLPLPFEGIPALGTGAELKLNFTLSDGKKAFLSPYLGNNSEKEVFDFYLETLDSYKKWFGIKPELVVSDLQPDFYTTHFAESLKIPHIKAQHHHAHIAAIMADNLLQGKVLGVALDGTGYGDDGAIWGGEIFSCDYSSYKRLFHLEYMPLPGGDAAIKHPANLAYCWQKYAGCESEIKLPENTKKILDAQLKNGLRMFETSSAGRLFDCVSAMLGLIDSISFEAQGAIRLEHFSDKNSISSYDYDFSGDIILISPLIKQIENDIKKGVKKELIAAKFHNTFINHLRDSLIRGRKLSGLNRVVLAGGVFQNKIILKGLIKELSKNDFTIFLPKKLPINDGSISFGQLVIGYKKSVNGG